ncbi:hypothetical protein O9992_07585 [Vibrio lentus]|nr:hypothetical protein [Vibrio lentus]
MCKDDCQQPMTADPMADEFAEQDVDAKVQYAPQVILNRNAFLVREMMYSNIWGGGDWSAGTGWNGTGWRAQPLKVVTLAAKPVPPTIRKILGTAVTALGMVATVQLGFDNHNRNLGRTKANSNLGKSQITGRSWRKNSRTCMG